MTPVRDTNSAKCSLDLNLPYADVLTPLCFRSLSQNDSAVETNGEDIQESRNALPDVSLVRLEALFEHSHIPRVRTQGENYELRQLTSVGITHLNNAAEDSKHERQPGRCQ